MKASRLLLGSEKIGVGNQWSNSLWDLREGEEKVRSECKWS